MSIIHLLLLSSFQASGQFHNAPVYHTIFPDKLKAIFLISENFQRLHSKKMQAMYKIRVEIRRFLSYNT